MISNIWDPKLWEIDVGSKTKKNIWDPKLFKKLGSKNMIFLNRNRCFWGFGIQKHDFLNRILCYFLNFLGKY